MVTPSNFNDVVAPILEAGSWSNYGTVPKHVIKLNEEQRRFNKNEGVTVEPISSSMEQASNGTPISITYTGRITVYHGNITLVNLMELDVIDALSSYLYTIDGIEPNPYNRNRKNSSYIISITQC